MTGQMGDAMKVLGRKIICMVRVSTLGETVEDTRDITLMTGNMAMEYTPGQMEDST